MAYAFNDDKTKYELYSEEYIRSVSFSGTPRTDNSEIWLKMGTFLVDDAFESAEAAEEWIAEHVLGIILVDVMRDDNYTGTKPAISNFGVEAALIGFSGPYKVRAFIYAKPSNTSHSYTGSMKIRMR